MPAQSHSHRISVDELPTIKNKAGGTTCCTAPGNAGQLIGVESDLRRCVQAVIGICRTKDLDVERMRFRVFTLTRSVCSGDSILAPAQILTRAFQPVRVTAVELVEADGGRELRATVPVRRDRACFALWSNSEYSKVTLGSQAVTTA